MSFHSVIPSLENIKSTGQPSLIKNILSCLLFDFSREKKSLEQHLDSYWFLLYVFPYMIYESFHNKNHLIIAFQCKVKWEELLCFSKEYIWLRHILFRWLSSVWHLETSSAAKMCRIIIYLPELAMTLMKYKIWYRKNTNLSYLECHWCMKAPNLHETDNNQRLDFKILGCSIFIGGIWFRDRLM